MSRDPFDRMLSGFEWSVGRRAAYKLPLGLGIVIVMVLSMLRHCS